MPRQRLSVRTDSPFWAKVERAYELWERAGDIDTNPTPEEAAEIWRTLKEEGLLDRRSGTTSTMVRAWFLDRQTYSPYVDEIAVERAMLWDAKVWDHLTAREASTVYDRVTAAPTPETSTREELEAWLLLPAGVRQSVVNGARTRVKRDAAPRPIVGQYGRKIGPMRPRGRVSMMPRDCVGCGRRLRAKTVKAADAPGTARYAGHGACETCSRKKVRAA